MIIQGVDTSTLVDKPRVEIVRPVIAGRTLQLDGDFVAYFVSAADDVPVQDMFKNADTIVRYLKDAAGAENVIVHLTPHGSTKGGRYDIARLKRYQANRENKEKPPHLEEVRVHLASTWNGKLWDDLEADDGMSIYQHACIQAGHPELSVICSKDKDLMIVPGYHLDWVTQELIKVTFAGEIHLKEMKSSKKLEGSGFKFFMAQMLMGDPADGISGLPKLCINGKWKPCGPVAAFNLLKDCRTSAEALNAVAYAYLQYSRAYGFKSYTGEDVSVDDAFESEAKLLWMRRFPDENDVLDLFNEVRNEA